MVDFNTLNTLYVTLIAGTSEFNLAQIQAIPLSDIGSTYRIH